MAYLLQSFLADSNRRQGMAQVQQLHEYTRFGTLFSAFSSRLLCSRSSAWPSVPHQLGGRGLERADEGRPQHQIWRRKDIGRQPAAAEGAREAALRRRTGREGQRADGERRRDQN
ncbi:hypothetical protein BRADI_1g47936v3 [Brachypodium distachyon]|uniref:Uncharacterized protein n=1 Tax=Brachypodium distachyon TaxID=15368 RepID=A0A0Q3H8L8_BRADI|nr:hypothetical protein BRADI_1g47936v3 [Brachypodium distachyon]